MFPDFLFQLGAKDQMRSYLEIVHVKATASASAVNVTANNFYKVAGDSVFLLLSVGFEMLAGAAQSGVYGKLLLDSNGGDRPMIAGFRGIGSASEVNAQHTHIYCPPGSELDFECQFNAGANPNSAAVDISGLLIPRGNFAWRAP